MAAPKGNKYALGNNGGRPCKWENPKEIEDQIGPFLEWCRENEEPVTITNFAVFIDTDRKTLFEYRRSEERKEFRPALKKVMTLCEAYAEKMLYQGKATGPIFSLVNNYGWENLQKINHAGHDGGKLMISLDE